MSGLLSLLIGSGGALARKNTEILLETNSISEQYGLSLTHADAVMLLEARDESLRENERIELGEGVIEQIILAFCDSPYLNEENYAETLCTLTDLFYYMKGETLEQMPDDELIKKMEFYFDNSAQGSLDLLASRELEAMAYNIRTYGTVEDPDEQEPAVVDENGEYLIEEDGKWRTMEL